MPYVATRYVPGLSLHDYVHEEGAIEGKDLTWFAACLAEGVASVHAVGVLHRDVKPSNVLMEGRTPILIDFGLARVADDPKLTHTGWLLGTPGYLAPEILYGEDATTASDVHSWAATVAFAATGRPPFGRGPSMAIMDRVRRGEHELSGIPDPLRQLLADCLEPEAERRPTLDAILGWLRPQVAPTSRARPRPAPAPDKLTMPYAAALASPDARSTDVLPGGPPVGADGTKMLTEHQTVMERDPRRLPPPPPAPAEQGRPPFAERARRATLLVVGALLCGGIVAAYPWYGSVALLLVVWLLRSGSLAASAAGARRRLRGAKWYDGAQLLIRAPWELLRTLAGTRDAPAVERRARGRRGPALLRVRGRGDGHPLRLRHRLRGGGVDRPGRVARAVSSVAGGEPGRAPLEAVAGRLLRAARARHRPGRARRVAWHVLVARERPSAQRTDPRTVSTSHARMGAMNACVIIIS